MATPTSLPSTFVAGNVLTAAEMNGLRGAFRILQVVSTTKTDTFSASISAGSDTAITGLSATITPSSTSSKILVFINASGARSGDEAIVNLRLYRDATEIGSGATAGNRTSVLVGNIDVATDTTTITTVSGHYLDSPSTTSSITYAVHATNAHSSTTYTFYINRSATDTDDGKFTRPGSSITLLEVSG
jgi:hypothetical protein